jgi:hypothetical protein
VSVDDATAARVVRVRGIFFSRLLNDRRRH